MASERDVEEGGTRSGTPLEPGAAPTLSNPTPPAPTSPERSSIDAIIEIYKRDVDRGLLREALRLTPDERIARVEELVRLADALQSANRRREDE